MNGLIYYVYIIFILNEIRRSPIHKGNDLIIKMGSLSL